ncbi:MAG TPA: ParB/RepB/Spo0J family partition protein [Candidatus Magasanikbacteria bacterium]|nr:ParB/RepB/Spo0J family partition protein [Candidatus Magasanikbacteria bacterium]
MALGKGLGSLISSGAPKFVAVPLPPKREEVREKNDGQRVWLIPITEIIPNPEQPRQVFQSEELADLVSSIKVYGVIQPLIVTERAEGGYELIAGERRLRASGMAGLTHVPALIRTATQQQKLELALIENIQRQDLNPIEEATAYAKLANEFNLTQNEIADRVGKGRSTVTNIMRLLDLPDVIRQALTDRKISMGQARAILSLRSPEEQIKLFEKMQNGKMTVRDVEANVARRGQIARKGTLRRDPNLTAQEQILEERFGTKVHLTQKGERGQIIIEYYTRDDLRRLMQELS